MREETTEGINKLIAALLNHVWQQDSRTAEDVSLSSVHWYGGRDQTVPASWNQRISLARQ